MPPGTVRCDAQQQNFPIAGLDQVPFVDPQGRRGAVILNLLEV